MAPANGVPLLLKSATTIPLEDILNESVFYTLFRKFDLYICNANRSHTNITYSYNWAFSSKLLFREFPSHLYPHTSSVQLKRDIAS